MMNIASQNALAVQMMSSGSYKEAIPLLTSALKTLRNEMAENVGTNSIGYERESHYKSVEMSITRMSSPATWSSADSQLSTLGMFTILDRFFLIDEKSFQHHASSESVTNHVVAVLLYNIALAFHLHGSRSEDRRQALRKALHYYDLAQKAAVTASDGMVSVQGDEVMLQLACCNNKGHIYSLLFQKDEAYRCLDWMREVVAVARPHIECEDFCSVVTDLVLTVTLFGHKDSLCAAPCA